MSKCWTGARLKLSLPVFLFVSAVTLPAGHWSSAWAGPSAGGQNCGALFSTIDPNTQGRPPGTFTNRRKFQVRIRLLEQTDGPVPNSIIDGTMKISEGKAEFFDQHGQIVDLETRPYAILSGMGARQKPLNTDYTFSFHTLRKGRDLFDITPDNLNDKTAAMRALGRIDANADQKTRYALLRNFDPAQMITKPGHMILRNSRAKLKAMADSLASESYQSRANSKPLQLNIVTDSKGNVLYVESWDGHHRMIALLEASRKPGGPKFGRIGDLGMENYEILINGRTVDGTRVPMRLPAHGTNAAHFERLEPASNSSSPDTILFDATIPVFELGSRTTVGRVHENVFDERPHPRVSMWMLEGDVLSDAQIETLLTEKRQTGDTSVTVIVPKRQPISAEKLNAMVEKVTPHENLDLYLGDLSLEASHFPRETFETIVASRLRLIYGDAEVDAPKPQAPAKADAPKP